jgi:hypothetical protein
MAETGKGNKRVYVHPYKRPDGTEVPEHYRSTPDTSTGRKSPKPPKGGTPPRKAGK